MRKVLFLFCVIVFVSCKESTSNKQVELKEKQEESVIRKIEKNKKTSDDLIIEFNIIAGKNDNIQVFYTEDYIQGFTEDKSVTAGFLGSADSQIITLKILENIYPVKYRFDIGSNHNQNEIKIISLSISYDGNEIFIPENKLLEYLIPNESITYNLEKEHFILSSYKLNDNNIYDPYFTCSPQLIKLISDL